MPMADGAIRMAYVGDITPKEDGAEYGRARIEVGTSSDTPIFTWEDPARRNGPESPAIAVVKR